MHGRCPVGLDASPAELDAGRHRALAVFKGDKIAAARPAAGFELDVTTRTDVAAWADRNAVECRVKLGTLTCEHVSLGALEGVGSSMERALFTFDAHDRLVGVLIDTERLSAVDATECADTTRQGLTSVLGRPSVDYGTATLHSLDQPMAQAGAEYRFADYRASVTATNVGNGIYLKQEYQAIR